MLKPDEVKARAAKLQNQNWDFRTFLKGHADDDELDDQCLALHNELFSTYDCCQCNNCCRTYRIILCDTDVTRISAYLKISESDFYDKYLEAYDDDEDDDEGEGGDEQYVFAANPCAFLQEDGRCQIQSCKPDVCERYPHTNQPDRLSSMISMIEFAETCPVVFEIIERLKALYRFRSKS
jgi:Fe-S-cluster containining protein